MGTYYSGKKPSSKAVFHPGKISVEQVEERLLLLRNLFNEQEGDLPEDMWNAKLITDAINDMFENEYLIAHLATEQIGLDYLIFSSMAVIDLKERGEDESGEFPEST